MWYRMECKLSFVFFLVKTFNNFWYDCGMANKMIPRFSFVFLWTLLFGFCVSSSSSSLVYEWIYSTFLVLVLSFAVAVAVFMLCRCTWIALFSFYMDYHRKVHMHCLFDNAGETDRRRKKYDMTNREWANKNAITDKTSEKACDEIEGKEKRTNEQAGKKQWTHTSKAAITLAKPKRH